MTVQKGMHQQSSCDYSSQEALCCFFFLSCLTNIYVFLYKKEKETVSSCLSLGDIFFYKYYKTTSLIPVFFSPLLFCFVVLHGHRLRMILFVFLFFLIVCTSAMLIFLCGPVVFSWRMVWQWLSGPTKQRQGVHQ